jgi:hypothetical protein
MTMTRNDPAVPAPAGDLRASSSVEQSEAAHKRGSSHADLRRPPGKKKRRKRRKRKRSRPGRRPGTEQGAGGGSRPTSRPACASWRALCSRGLEHRARTQLGDEDQDVRLNMLAVADMTTTGSRWRSQIGFGFVVLLFPFSVLPAKTSLCPQLWSIIILLCPHKPRWTSSSIVTRLSTRP